MKILSITGKSKPPAPPKFLQVGGKKGKAPEPPAPAPVPPPKAPGTFEAVLVEHDGRKFAAVLEGKSPGGMATVRLAVPSAEGILCVTDQRVTVSTEFVNSIKGAVCRESAVESFREFAPFSFEEGKAFREVKNSDGAVVDYLDILIEGLASTFKATTPADRDGEHILPGAFNATLSEFKRNPVMLVDHQNSVFKQAGSFTKVVIQRDGLAVTGKVTNSPDMRHVRFLIAEGHLKAFSIGGAFFFKEGNRQAIEQVNLYEITLTPIPVNQDALFQRRAINLEDAKAALSFSRWAP